MTSVDIPRTEESDSTNEVNEKPANKSEDDKPKSDIAQEQPETAEETSSKTDEDHDSSD